MSTHSATALEVIQDLLDQITPCVMGGRLSELERFYCLPYRRIFLNREVVIETVEEMHADLGTFGRSLQAVGANQLICLASRAERIGTRYVSGRYTIHILRDAQTVIPSYECQVVAVRMSSGRWALQELHHNVHVTGFPIDLVHVPLAPPALPDTPQDDARRMAMDALSIYQRYLDQTAAVIAADDFQAYANLMAFPYTAHGSEMDQTIAGPGDLRPFFQVLRRCHNGEVGDEVRRVAERAEFIGSDLICGYHTGTVYLAGKETVAPVRSRLILTRQGPVWRLRSVTNSICNSEYPFNMYKPGGVLRTELQLEKTVRPVK